MRLLNFVILALIAVLSAASAFAEGNLTNSTVLLNQTAPYVNVTNTTVPISIATNISNKTGILVNAVNQTVQQMQPVVNFTVSSFVPKEFKTGDIQFNVQVQNTGTVELKNVMAIITGRGFYMSDAVPIDLLKPGEKSYIIVMGSIQEEGNKRLTIRIFDKVFYQNVTIIDPNSQANKQKLDEMQKREEESEAQLAKLSGPLNELKNSYSQIEGELADKKAKNYDVSAVTLDDLKTFIRNAESSIIVGDAKQANASITLAYGEYAAQKRHLDSSQKIKKPFGEVIRDNIVLLSSMAGALITVFTLYEILKKKKDALYQRIKEVKVNDDTKVVIEQKRKAHKK